MELWAFVSLALNANKMLTLDLIPNGVLGNRWKVINSLYFQSMFIVYGTLLLLIKVKLEIKAHHIMGVGQSVFPLSSKRKVKQTTEISTKWTKSKKHREGNGELQVDFTPQFLNCLAKDTYESNSSIL